MLRFALLIAAIVTSFASVDTAQVLAASQSMSRAEIRSMPIDARPSRPGHVYGNTVRRRHSR